MAFITAYWGLDGIIVLTTLFVTIYFYMTRKFNYWKKRGVIEATPTPIIGNFGDCMLLKKSPGYFLKDLYNQGKGMPYIGCYILDKPTLLIRDPKIIKDVLIKDFNIFSNRFSSPDKHERLAYCNIFFMRNPAWKLLRTHLSPTFTSGKLKNMFELMLECNNNLYTHLESLKSEDNCIELDLKEVSSKYFTDIIGSIAFGLNVNSLNNPDSEFRKCGKRIFEVSLIRGFVLLAVFFLPRTILYLFNLKMFEKKISIYLRKVFWETIMQRMESGKKRNDLIDILIKLKLTYKDQDLEGYKFDGDDLLAQAASFFTASYETSSTTMTFTLYELAICPEIQDRLRNEILNALNETDGKVTYDMIPSLSYLDMVVSETLRKYPPLSFLDRLTEENYKIPNLDLVLEKDTPIFISLLGMHYDPEYFPEPNKFDPERFTEENKRNRPSYVYLPFGDGPRSCIGNRMGLLQTKLGIITILKKYEVIPCEKTLIPIVIDPTLPLTTALGGTIHLKLRKINNIN